MTIREAIEQAHCRTGKAWGTTKRGAFWLASRDKDGDPDSITIRSWGGDGIGQSAPSHGSYLQLRHYRSGEVAVVAHHTSHHQNGSWSGGDVSEYQTIANARDCETAEDLIVLLKGTKYGEDGGNVYGDYFEDDLIAALGKLGIPAAAPAPDEIPADSV